LFVLSRLAMVTPRRRIYLRAMSRGLRPHLPGAVFHLTARLQNREPLFAGIEGVVVRICQEATQRSDAELLAYAVMPNHLHLLLHQGRRPLSHYMQPLLRRVALLVHRRHSRDGHVFERRFRHAVCADPDYFRNAVAYVHLNPLRAGLCADPAEYQWTSHRAYLSPHAEELAPRFSRAVATSIASFATCNCLTAPSRVAAYSEFIAWRRRMDAYLAAGGEPCARCAPVAPVCRDGTEHWWAAYRRPAGHLPAPPLLPPPDIRRIAAHVLADVAPGESLDWLRSGARDRHLVRARRELCLRARSYGYRTEQIARFLCISATSVSRALAAPAVQPPG
jgi:REP element-mobilizing transposase RayT